MGHQKQSVIERNARRAGRNAPAKTKVKFDDYVFIRIELSTEEKADFDEWRQASDPPLVVLRNLTVEGHKLSQSTADNGNTIVCSLTVTDATDINAGGILSGRGRDVEQAIQVLDYKLWLIGDRTWSEAEHERGGSYSNEIG